MLGHIPAVVSAFLLLIGIAAAQEPGGARVALEAPDRQLVGQASQRAAFEREMARLAMERAAAEPVRDFARRMEEEGQDGTAALLRIAGAAGAEPAEALGEDEASALERLGTVEGAAFDQAYLHASAQNHMRQYNVVAKLAAQARDGELRRLAESLEGELAERLDLVQALRRDIYPIVQGPVGVVPGQQEPPAAAVPQARTAPYSDTAEGAEP